MARVFNGTTDLIKATGGAAWKGPRNAVSLAFWCKGAAQQNKTCYMDGRNATSGFISLGTQNAVGGTKCRAVVSTNAGSTILDVTTTGVIVDNTSHHVLFTMDASGNYVIYVDGISDLTGSLVSDTDPLDTWTGIGSLERTTNTQFFTGNIAEVANWSRQLSAVEAAQLVGGLPASQLVPDHYWPLRGVASPESDVGTVGGADGTLTGTTSIVGPPEVDYTTFYPSLASRRPVPMIKGPDKDKLLGMRGNSY